MIRGTTPTYIFPIPFDSANIEKLRITFEQGSVEITKTEDECTFNNKEIICRLTQQDTFSFEAGYIDVQIRGLTKNNEVIATLPSKITCYDSLNEEVLV